MEQKLLLKSAYLLECGGIRDVLIVEGKIAEIAPQLYYDGVEVYNCGENLLLPAFVDCHTHLDKAYIPLKRETASLMDAVIQVADFTRSLPQEGIQENILARARTVLDEEMRSGSCTVRTHVSVDEIWSMEAFFATLRLKKEYAGKLRIQTSVPHLTAVDGAWQEAAKAGLIDYIGGYPSFAPNPYAEVDRLFDLALRYALPLDLHVDETDAPNIGCFLYVLEKTKQTGMGGRVNCSHVTALSAVEHSEAERAAELCEKADVSVITLPSCNMYLMGRLDRGLIRRGITRVEELLAAGVNIAFASDNISDPFRPFGRGDMLEEAYFTAQVLSRGTEKGLCDVLHMGTYAAARASGLTCYGIMQGANADLTLLDGKNAREAMRKGAPRKLVLHGGVPVTGVIHGVSG